MMPLLPVGLFGENRPNGFHLHLYMAQFLGGTVHKLYWTHPARGRPTLRAQKARARAPHNENRNFADGRRRRRHRWFFVWSLLSQNAGTKVQLNSRAANNQQHTIYKIHLWKATRAVFKAYVRNSRTCCHFRVRTKRRSQTIYTRVLYPSIRSGAGPAKLRDRAAKTRSAIACPAQHIDFNYKNKCEWRLRRPELAARGPLARGTHFRNGNADRAGRVPSKYINHTQRPWLYWRTVNIC